MLNQIIRINGEGGESQGGAPDYPPIISGFDPSGEEGGEEVIEVSSEMLYASSGKLMYSTLSNLWARWVFAQSTKNLFPTVLINGTTECKEHSTYHIVKFKVTKKSGTVKVRMTMKSSGENCNWDGSARCTYQLWGGKKEFSEADGHGKQKSGTCAGGATFTVIIGKEDYRIT